MSDVFEVAYMRGVVSFGLLVILAALAPVTLVRYDLSEHQVWALSSLLVLVGGAVLTAVMTRTPEWRADWPPTGRLRLVALAGWVLFMVVAALPPVVVILGLAPDLEAAVYFSIVVVILLFDAWLLLQLVFRGRQSASA